MKLVKAPMGILLLGLCVLLLLSACGGAQKSDPVPGESGEETSLNEDKPDKSAEKESEAAGEPQEFTDDYGRRISLQEAPQRILGVYLEDPLVALGVKPLLQFSFGGTGGAAYLQEYIGDVPMAGNEPMPNPEWVLELNPDLIITHSLVLAADKIEAYAKIAPTYSIDAAQSDWKQILEKIGKLLGKSEQVVELMEKYDQRLVQAKEELSRLVGTETFALVRIAKSKDIRVYRVNDPFSGDLLYNDFGLTPHSMVKELPEDGNISISMEVIAELDADHIILVVNDAGAEQAEELESSALWKSLPAYRNDQIYKVDPSLWLSLGYMANTKKIDNLLQLVGQ